MADTSNASDNSFSKVVAPVRKFLNPPSDGRSISDTLSKGAQRLGSIALKAAFQGPKAAIDEYRKPIPDSPKQFSTSDGREPVLGSFRKGGTVPTTGAYRLHQGERVIPPRSGGRR
jgi:hypothetical protein